MNLSAQKLILGSLSLSTPCLFYSLFLLTLRFGFLQAIKEHSPPVLPDSHYFNMWTRKERNKQRKILMSFSFFAFINKKYFFFLPSDILSKSFLGISSYASASKMFTYSNEPGEGTATHSNVLAWRIPCDHWVSKSWTRLVTFTEEWRKEEQLSVYPQLVNLV